MTNPAQGTPRTECERIESTLVNSRDYGPWRNLAYALEAKLTAAESALAEANVTHTNSMKAIGVAMEQLQENLDVHIDILKQVQAERDALQSQLAAAQRDAELLNWLEENHFFSGTEGEGNRSLVWKFHTPNNGRQWQPLREKLAAEIALSATSAGEKGDGE